MTKLPVIAFTAIVAAAGLAAPAFAATSTSAVDKVGNVPYCSNGDSANLDKRMDALSTQLQLSTKPGTSIAEWNGCLQVTTIEHGKSVMAYYDPDTLDLIAKVG